MERYLILHCAPTLAGIKTANLFTYTFMSEEDLKDSLSLANKILNPKGVYAQALLIRNNKALIYVYRKSLLTADLMRKGAKELLGLYGYHGDSLDNLIFWLKVRLDINEGFPHEVGLFLGYPLADVIEFIKNEGKNSKCTGCWKVYTDECEALKIFAKYRKCKDIYTRLFFQGRSVGRLTIVA
ncbi:DUF3793 family protein [Tissierella sp. Yu-01]|uniref:DUF3793 family protein n=1 Tax=Tissierella sp. Yu-01 TaxID=3035694 RepID=UPI00240E2066|nr:DUF3793 family protein [Tissierella sp. Yu-01]WFA09302.1 DUF3793 family protein [Tissierella sp. Yu-01]